MTERERQVCKEGMEAACRWLYEGESTLQHIRGEPMDGRWWEGYVADIQAIRAACRLLGVKNEALGYRAGGTP